MIKLDKDLPHEQHLIRCAFLGEYMRTAMMQGLLPKSANQHDVIPLLLLDMKFIKESVKSLLKNL